METARLKSSRRAKFGVNLTGHAASVTHELSLRLVLFFKLFFSKLCVKLMLMKDVSKRGVWRSEVQGNLQPDTIPFLRGTEDYQTAVF